MLIAAPFRALADQWRDEAHALRTRYADDRAATLFERLAEDLEETLRSTEDHLLTLQQASELSGYSIEHLGRMIREGKIPNAGRKGAPRIRLRDCPRKTTGLTATFPTPQLESAHAEQVVAAIVAQAREA